MRLKALIALTALAIGRAMTLPFIGRAGDGGVGDPPEAWLMPLVGDAAIGIAAIGVTVLLLVRRSVATWAIAIGFHTVAAFDAVAALLIELSTPWPEFFMIQIFGRSMFLAATAMHVAALALLASTDVRSQLGVETDSPAGGLTPAR